MATAAAAGTVVLVDAALAPYDHPELRWLVRQHVLNVLQDFPSLSPSVDAYTSDHGESTVLLNARGLLAVSRDLPPVRLTLWLPREYPYLPPLVYAFPAAPSASLVPDHPFVDHHTGRVHGTLPYLDAWCAPESSLTGLVLSLVGALRMCHPLTASFGFVGAPMARATRSPADEEHERMITVLTNELVARLGRDTAAFRRRVDEDILAMSSLQASLRARAGAVDHAVRDLEEERMRLERAVTASHSHHGQLIRWLQKARHADVPPDAGAAMMPVAEAGDARPWIETKAAELAADDTMDALGDALENGAIGFQEYIKRIKTLSREQFFHCYAASTLMRRCTSID